MIALVLGVIRRATSVGVEVVRVPHQVGEDGDGLLVQDADHGADVGDRGW